MGFPPTRMGFSRESLYTCRADWFRIGLHGLHVCVFHVCVCVRLCVCVCACMLAIVMGMAWNYSACDRGVPRTPSFKPRSNT